jgi:HSP20 family molecular chaperone IbpA
MSNAANPPGLVRSRFIECPFEEENIMANENPSTQSSGGKAAVKAGENRTPAAENVLRPPVDIHETADAIVLDADMPGVTRERLEVRLDGNTLVIEGAIGIAPQDQMTALYADVRSTTYRRQFVLSSELEAGKIAANLQNGVLTVTIPKRDEVRPRRIEVQ